MSTGAKPRWPRHFRNAGNSETTIGPGAIASTVSRQTRPGWSGRDTQIPCPRAGRSSRTRPKPDRVLIARAMRSYLVARAIAGDGGLVPGNQSASIGIAWSTVSGGCGARAAEKQLRWPAGLKPRRGAEARKKSTSIPLGMISQRALNNGSWPPPPELLTAMVPA
jgi:hypothetical protein